MRLRQAATLLLDFAIRIAPPDTHDWGLAMQGELNHVQGSWSAFSWALGGATVLAKGALASFLIPGRRGQGLVPDGGLFAKSVSLRRAALATSGACVLVALLFFLAPPFRQAFRVALEPCYFFYQTASRHHPQTFEPLARRAEAQHDPEGLAFCAVRLEGARESARLAEEAVRLDPNLLWIFAVVAMRHPALPEVSQWIPRLEPADPDNALFYLITAESIDLAHFQRGVWTPPKQGQESAWQSAMGAAFASTRFNDYLDRVAELNRRVVPRYDFYDPDEVQSRERLDLPVWAFENSERYAKSLLHAAGDRKATRVPKGAGDRCWEVARFGRLLDSQGHTGFEHLTGTSLQAMAFKQLQEISAAAGNPEEAELYTYLAAKFDPVKGEHPGFPGESAFDLETSQRNAAVVTVSGLMMLVFFGLELVATAILIAGSRRGARPASQRAKPVAAIVVFASALGLLFSSVTLYLTYRPYWYMFQSAILSGGRSQTRDFIFFLTATRRLPGVPPDVYLNALLYSGSPSFLFYVWTGVTLLSVMGLILIVLRRLLSRPRTRPAT